MKTDQTKYTGAFGVTEISLTPQSKRSLTFDVRNCPHCGVHHASLDAEVSQVDPCGVMRSDQLIVRCPALGGAPIYLTTSLSLYVP
jgi:hypothetical protein